MDERHKVAVLVSNAKTGDRTSLEKLAAVHHRMIFGLIYHRIADQMDAEDLTQEVFEEMTRGIKKLRDPLSFKTWLCRIALNRVTDFHRRKKRRSFWAVLAVEGPIETREDAKSPLEQVQEKEFWRQLHGLVQKMPRKEREAFLLRYVDQLRIREIGEALRISESAAKTHLSRALKKLKTASAFRALARERTS
jgi:RNA polymerase sigma-70 factor (ECF subfamily)